MDYLGIGGLTANIGGFGNYGSYGYWARVYEDPELYEAHYGGWSHDDELDPDVAYNDYAPGRK